MNIEQKKQVEEVLKDKFSQYSNFYLVNTESLTVAQINKLRRLCFDKKIEMKVAKNTLIKKALESLDKEKYKGVYGSLNGVTALMLSENAKEPALIISGFRQEIQKDIPVLKAAFIDNDVFIGEGQLATLKSLKSKQELVGEIITLLQSPAKNVIGGLQNSGNTLAGILSTLEKRSA